MKNNFFHIAVTIEQKIVHRKEKFNLRPGNFCIPWYFKNTIVKDINVADAIRTNDIGITLPDIYTGSAFMYDIIVNKNTINSRKPVWRYEQSTTLDSMTINKWRAMAGVRARAFIPQQYSCSRKSFLQK